MYILIEFEFTYSQFSMYYCIGYYYQYLLILLIVLMGNAGMKVSGGCFRVHWPCLKLYRRGLLTATWLTKKFRITLCTAMTLMCFGSHKII